MTTTTTVVANTRSIAGQKEASSRVDLQISGAGLVNSVLTKRLRPSRAGKKYATFALNSLNLHQAPVSLLSRSTERHGRVISLTAAVAAEHIFSRSNRRTNRTILSRLTFHASLCRRMPRIAPKLPQVQPGNTGCCSNSLLKE